MAPLLGLIDELDPEVRLQALTHSSWTERRVRSWGRLAFLGDSVLGLAVAEHLFTRFPRSDIGRLTKIHGQVGQRPGLRGGRLRARRPGDARGGLPGGLRRRAGAGRAGRQRAGDGVGRRVADRRLLPRSSGSSGRPRRCWPRSRRRSSSPRGRCSTSSRRCRSGSPATGAASATRSPRSPGRRTTKIFRVEARVGDEVVGTGTGSSKKAAEQAAAAEALGENGP